MFRGFASTPITVTGALCDTQSRTFPFTRGQSGRFLGGFFCAVTIAITRKTAPAARKTQFTGRPFTSGNRAATIENSQARSQTALMLTCRFTDGSFQVNVVSMRIFSGLTFELSCTRWVSA